VVDMSDYGKVPYMLLFIRHFLYSFSRSSLCKFCGIVFVSFTLLLYLD
jgi:hypothetical protein